MKLDDLWCNLRHFPTISIHKVAVFTIFELDFMESAELQAMETNCMRLLFLVGGWGHPPLLWLPLLFPSLGQIVFLVIGLSLDIV